MRKSPSILMIDTEEETWINKQLPDGIEAENREWRLFANRLMYGRRYPRKGLS